jgi:OmcA/MtrC family decaheme c-type cytochrome
MQFANHQEATTSPTNAFVLTGTTQTVGGRPISQFPNLAHKIHMGNELVKTGYNFVNQAVGQFNANGLPQDPRNCTTCHTGTAIAGTALAKGNQNVTPDGDNWKNSPSMLACGACHDGINFSTGTGATLADAAQDTANHVAVGTTQSGHVGGPQADNTRCVLCHTNATIPVYHETTFSTPANAVAQSGISSFGYNLGSVSVNGSGYAVIKFQIIKDGAVVTALPVAPLVTNASTGQMVVSPAYEPIPGFASGPTLYVVYGVPQDNISTPVDFNARSSVALTNLLIAGGSPGQGTLSNAIANGAYQADANGYFTATLTGDLVGQPVGNGCVRPVAPATASCVNTAVVAAPLVVPASAQMVTGVILGGFTQKNLAAYPYTAANVSVNPTTAASGGLATVAILKKMVATGYTARRVVVDINKCDTCHDQLGTNPSFHGGVRNDPTACAICHNTTGVDTGWSYNVSTFIHGIHAAGFRAVPYNWQSGEFVNLRYPGVLQDCNQCHVPNSVNFGASGMTLQPNLLWTTDATGTTAAPGAGTSPFISQVAGTKYGLGFQFTPAGSTVAAYTLVNGTVVAAHVAAAGGDTRQAEATTLVNSPISAACFACHETTSDRNHMTTNGGIIYQPRSSTALTGNGAGEACLVCHGQGQIEDVAAVHQSVFLTGAP